MTNTEYEATKTVVSATRSKSIKVEALVDVNIIRKNGLEVEPEESEHKWHADIIGWLDKSERKSIAQEIARSAKLANIKYSSQ